MLKKMVIIMSISSIMLSISGCSNKIENEAVDIEEYGEFLNKYYGVNFKKEVSEEEFTIETLKVLGELADYPEEVNEKGFSVKEMIITSLYYVNLDELGYTYPKEKVDEVLKGWEKLGEGLLFARKQELAAAIDTGLISQQWKNINLDDNVSKKLAEEMLGKIAQLTGNYKNFLGYSTDNTIYNKLIYSWESFDLILEPQLQLLSNELIKDGTITGYNIKRASQSFTDDDKTIVYGHSNIDHARQLIGLLRSENMKASIQLEGKTSAFTWLADWGDVPAGREFLADPLEDGNYIVFVKEYDLSLEFENKDDKEKFNNIINMYAKKDSADETGLIISSWWQPLYMSNIELNDYVQIKNHKAVIGSIYVQSFSLIEKSELITEKFNESFVDAEVEVVDLWVNTAFHNYLLGESK